ncbi:MAG: ATP-binding protein [Phycisphaerales bacterium]
MGTPRRAGPGLAPVRIRPKVRAIEDAAERLPTLAHELSNLLDGSMRSLNLVLRSREAHDVDTATVDETDRRLRTVRAALEQMHELVRDAVGRSAWRRETVGGPRALCLGDAVRYATDLLDPAVRESRTTLRVTIDAALESAPAGPFFALTLNGVRNAIEAVTERARTAPDAPREVEVAVRAERSDAQGETWVLEILDTGLGPPLTPPSARRLPGPFDTGFSTKPGGSGLGLALCREMVDELGGTIVLERGPGGVGARLLAAVSAGAVRRAGGHGDGSGGGGA